MWCDYMIFLWHWNLLYFHLNPDIAGAMHEHCDNTYRTHNISYDRQAFTIDNILNNIHCIFCNSFTDFLIALIKLRQLLTHHSNVRFNEIRRAITTHNNIMLYTISSDPASCDRFIFLFVSYIDARWYQQTAFVVWCHVRFTGFGRGISMRGTNEFILYI